MNALIARPKSRLDTVVVFLVLLQIVYCYWEGPIVSRGVYPWRLLSAIAVYPIIIFALTGYIRGQKWAWAMIFLFSLYILHQAFLLRLYWNDGTEHSLALLELVASAVCLRILSSTAKNHFICRGEFAKVLGAIAMAAAVIFVRGSYFPPIRNLYIPSFSISPWVVIETMSQITAWRMLMLLWCCYAGICIIAWIAARYILDRSIQAHP